MLSGFELMHKFATKISSLSRKAKLKTFSPIITFIWTLTLLIPYLREPFFTDEGDNMLGGVVVSEGGAIYREFISQHTPFMYYLNALFALLGAKEAIFFRLYFYIFIALMVAVMVRTLRHKVPWSWLLIWSTLYVTSFYANPPWSYVVLAEHITGLALAYMCLEIISTRNLEQTSSLRWLGFGAAGVISIFSSFVSIYAIAVGAVALFILNIRNPLEKNWNLKKELTRVGYVSLKAFLGFAAPALLLLLIPVATGTFDQFIYQAFTFNVDIYSKYIGGFGADALAPIRDSVVNFFGIFSNIQKLSEHSFSATRHLLNVLGVLVLVTWFYFQRKVLIGTAVLAIAIMASVRTAEGFHAIQFWSVSALCIAISISVFVTQIATLKKPLLKTGAIFLSTLLIIFSSGAYVAQIIYRHALTLNETALKAEIVDKNFFINRLLADKETFFQTGLDPFSYINNNKSPVAGVYGLVPWAVDGYGDEIFEGLVKAKPLLIFHNSDNEVWGYKVGLFAPKLDDYIRDNYSVIWSAPLEAADYAWVRNDELQNVREKLSASRPSIFCVESKIEVQSPQAHLGEIVPSVQIRQTFISEANDLTGITVMFGTFVRTNTSALILTLLDENGHDLRQEKLRQSELQDNQFWAWNFAAVPDSKSKKYSLVVTTQDGSPGNSVTIWRSTMDAYKKGALFLNGIEQQGDLNFGLNYLPSSMGNKAECQF